MPSRIRESLCHFAGLINGAFRLFFREGSSDASHDPFADNSVGLHALDCCRSFHVEYQGWWSSIKTETHRILDVAVLLRWTVEPAIFLEIAKSDGSRKSFESLNLVSVFGSPLEKPFIKLIVFEAGRILYLARSLPRADGGDVLDRGCRARLVDPEAFDLCGEEILAELMVFDAADDVLDVFGMDGDDDIASANLRRHGSLCGCLSGK